MNPPIILISDKKQHIYSLKDWAKHHQTPIEITDEIQKGFKILFEKEIKMLIVDIPEDFPMRMERLLTFFNKMEVPCLILTQDYSFYLKYNNASQNKYVRAVLYQTSQELPFSVFDMYFKRAKTSYKIRERVKTVHKKEKPILISLLAKLMIIEPIIKTLALFIFSNLSFMDFLSSTPDFSNILSFFNFWFLFPLAGYCLLGNSMLSFLGFVGIITFSCIKYFFLKPFIYPVFPIYSHIHFLLFLSLSLIAIVYFIMPEGKKDLLSRSGSFLRKYPRYPFEEECYIELENKETIEDCHFRDISMGGAMVKTPSPLFIGDTVHIQTKRNFPLMGRVVRHAQFGDSVFNGIEFEFISLTNRQRLKKLISELSKNKRKNV